MNDKKPSGESNASKKLNNEIVKLIKDADPDDIVEVLRDQNSIMARMHNNCNNNREVE